MQFLLSLQECYQISAAQTSKTKLICFKPKWSKTLIYFYNLCQQIIILNFTASKNLNFDF